MNYFFVTGSSKGIGKALCEILLRNPQNRVVGVARTQSIFDENYRHFKIDLSKIGDLMSIFSDLEDAKQLVLINNAAVLGRIGYVGEVDIDFSGLVHTNINAVFVLCANFLKKYHAISCKKIIVTISSGAGKRAIDGWAGYCASKAAIDMFSETIRLEQKIRGNDVHVFSVSPSVVATEMQSQIRESLEHDFSSVKRFQELYANEMLLSPEESAQKILKIIENPTHFKTVLQDVRTI